MHTIITPLAKAKEDPKHSSSKKTITEILSEGKGGTGRKRPVEAGVMKI
jgi:hypothetical protein